jgi:tRNA-splicing ligase RtcB
MIFGRNLIDEQTIAQLDRCGGDIAVLTADAHFGYGHPIGGAVAYRNKISLSGVGFDIACGNEAVKTDIMADSINAGRVMDEIFRRISFGVGRINDEPVEHPVIERIAKSGLKNCASMWQMAEKQLGTVGSGNHFVDLFRDEEGWLWIGVHFGSRGFGHKTTTGFIALSHGKKWGEKAGEGGMDAPPILFDTDSEIGNDYIEALSLAGEYAYAGRDMVVSKVLEILDRPSVVFEVHNHHNFAWREEHFGEQFWVVRKGCTPAFPGQQGFVGATMADTSVVVEGIDSSLSQDGLYSTVHGAGRLMSRTMAAGKKKLHKWWKCGDWHNCDGRIETSEHHHKEDPTCPKCAKRMLKEKRWEIVKPGVVNWADSRKHMAELGIELRGGGADESWQCYKRLDEVLSAQGETIRVLHRLEPIGVAMAGGEVFDPYKD